MTTEVKNKKLKFNIGSFRNILGGKFLTDEKTTRNFPYLMFLAFLGFIYIGNSYYAESSIRNAEKMNKELRELRYKHISTRAALMQRGRQSKVASVLEKKGIKESKVPPKRIIEMN